MLKILILSILFSFIQIASAADNFISVKNTKAFQNFFPVGFVLSIQYFNNFVTHTTVEMINDFDSNELRAKDKYKKTFILSGKVVSVKENISGKPYIILRGSGRFDFVNAYIEEENKEYLYKLNSGDELDLVCANASLFIKPMAKCFIPALTPSPEYEYFYNNQNKSKLFKTVFIIYSTLEDKIESACEKSIKSCDEAAMKLIKGKSGLKKMLEPHLETLNTIVKK